jgi:hypothetical protein
MLAPKRKRNYPKFHVDLDNEFDDFGGGKSSQKGKGKETLLSSSDSNLDVPDLDLCEEGLDWDIFDKGLGKENMEKKGIGADKEDSDKERGPWNKCKSIVNTLSCYLTHPCSVAACSPLG